MGREGRGKRKKQTEPRIWTRTSLPGQKQNGLPVPAQLCTWTPILLASEVKVRCPEGTKDPSHRVCIGVCLCLSFCLCLLPPVSLHAHVGIFGDKKTTSSAIHWVLPFLFFFTQGFYWLELTTLAGLPGQEGSVGSTCLCLTSFTSGITSVCHHPLHFFFCLNVGPGG